MNRATRFVLAVLAGALFLAGCGGGSSSGGSDADQIKAVGEQAARAYADKDWQKICDLSTPEVQQLVQTAGRKDTCAAAFASLAESVDLKSVRFDTGDLAITGSKAIARNGEISDRRTRDAYFEKVGGTWLLGPNDSE